jgi:hypothetical protein
MEPYWNKVRLEQVKGRAIRICSHKDLDFKERTVDIYTYYSIFSNDQLVNNKIDIQIMMKDNKETSDENVYNISVKKEKINEEILMVMKESAVDCELNMTDNFSDKSRIACARIEGDSTKYIFDPDLEVDKIMTAQEFKEVRRQPQQSQKVVSKPGQVISKVAQSMRYADNIVKKYKIKKNNRVYILSKSEESDNIYSIYEETDDTLSHPIGRVEANPVADESKESIFKGQQFEFF